MTPTLYTRRSCFGPTPRTAYHVGTKEVTRAAWEYAAWVTGCFRASENYEQELAFYSRFAEHPQRPSVQPVAYDATVKLGDIYARTLVGPKYNTDAFKINDRVRVIANHLVPGVTQWLGMTGLIKYPHVPGAWMIRLDDLGYLNVDGGYLLFKETELEVIESNCEDLNHHDY